MGLMAANVGTMEIILSANNSDLVLMKLSNTIVLGLGLPFHQFKVSANRVSVAGCRRRKLGINVVEAFQLRSIP